MQSKKPRDCERLSPLGKTTKGKPAVSAELRAVSQRGGLDGSHEGDDRRSLNPTGLDEPSGDGGRSSPKRRVSYLPSHGARDGRLDSRPAISGHIKKRSSNDVVKQRELELGEFIGDSDADTDDSRLMHGQSNDYATRRFMDGREFSQSKILPSAREYAMVDRKAVATKDGVVGEPYCELCAMEAALQNTDMRRYESERYGCQDHYNKLQHLKPQQQSDARFHSRAVARSALPAAYSKKSSYHNDYGRSSGSHSRRELMYSHGIREPLKFINKNSERQKYAETSYAGADYQRMLTDSGRDSDMGLRNMPIHRQHGYDTLRDEQDYFDVKPQGLAHEIDNLHETIPVHDQASDQVQYNHGEINNHARNMTGPSIARVAVDNDEENAEDYRNFERRSTWNHATMEDLTVPKSFKASDVSHQGWTRADYGSTRAIHKSRSSQESAFLRIGVKQVNQMSKVRPGYDIRRDDDSLIPKEAYFDASMSNYDRGMHRTATRLKRLKVEEGCSYESYNRVPKRKMYDREEDFGGYANRGSMPANRNICEFEDLDSSEELVEEDYRTELFSSSGVTYDSDEERLSEMAYYRQRHHQDEVSDDCWSYQNGSEHQQVHPLRLSEHGHRYSKSYLKSQPFKQHKSQHSYKKRFYKNQKIRKRYDEYNEGQHSNDGNGLEEPQSAVVSEFPEESEEFEKSVHEAFLNYSKKLNTNSRVQGRYLAQGKAGSLFCVVCGVSSSKEFQGTQNLAKHALMSRKIGLRAQHLGLHRAICVLLGWSLVTADPINWVPEVLPDDIALTQKEDLILWPPLVVIHNMSMAVDDPKDQRVIPRERVEAFLRGKGFAEGKMVVCLGKPADQSVIVVKFLNTFSGLGNAGKLHEYFAENKRGRVEFQKRTTDHGKGNDSEALGMRGDDQEETLLYGYMGIAEDLDKIDYYAKKTSWVKSKKEIYDLANAPVKSKEN